MKLEMPDSNMSENSKYSLLLLGSVLLLVFVVLYIMQPLREDIQKNEQELTQAQQRLASYQTFAEQNKDYNAFAAKQEGYLAEAKKLLPDIVTVPELVQEYSNLSKECGIQFKSVSFSLFQVLCGSASSSSVRQHHNCLLKFPFFVLVAL